MSTIKKLLWKLLIKSFKFMFSGLVTLISFAGILEKMKGGNK